MPTGAGSVGAVSITLYTRTVTLSSAVTVMVTLAVVSLSRSRVMLTVASLTSVIASTAAVPSREVSARRTV